MKPRGYEGPASGAVSRDVARQVVRRVTAADIEADVRDFYAERAAIMEVEGKLPRAIAERRARERAMLHRRLLVLSVERAS